MKQRLELRNRNVCGLFVGTLARAVMLGLVVVMCACAGFKTANQDEFNLITTARTPLFEQGPQQTTPPEAYLEAGTRIRMLHSAGTHIQVETVHGMKGFIATSDVGPLP